MEQLKLRVRNGICICFTAQGKETATRLLEKLSQQMEEEFDFLDYTGSEHSKPLKQVVKEAFQEKEAILFVGAAGIAVRLIAPWVQDKLKDPAVLVIDEQGRYAIPILSGHVGGCNELAEAAAQILGAEPVITTATDLRQAFAVDVFAAENELVISDRELAKQISAAELRGEKIGFFSDYPVDGIVPAEITLCDAETGRMPEKCPSVSGAPGYGDWAAGEEGTAGCSQSSGGSGSGNRRFGEGG